MKPRQFSGSISLNTQDSLDTDVETTDRNDTGTDENAGGAADDDAHVDTASDGARNTDPEGGDSNSSVAHSAVVDLEGLYKMLVCLYGTSSPLR